MNPPNGLRFEECSDCRSARHILHKCTDRPHLWTHLASTVVSTERPTVADHTVFRRLADIFSLGKVLYEAYTGLDREQFPSLPMSWLVSPGPGFAEPNQVVLRACEVNPTERYQSAAEFWGKLEELRERFEGGRGGTTSRGQ